MYLKLQCIQIYPKLGSINSTTGPYQSIITPQKLQLHSFHDWNHSDLQEQKILTTDVHVTITSATNKTPFFCKLYHEHRQNWREAGSSSQISSLYLQIHLIAEKSLDHSSPGKPCM